MLLLAVPPTPSQLYPYNNSVYQTRSFTENEFYHWSWNYGGRIYEYWWHWWQQGGNSIDVDIGAFCKGYKKMYVSKRNMRAEMF